MSFKKPSQLEQYNSTTKDCEVALRYLFVWVSFL